MKRKERPSVEELQTRPEECDPRAKMGVRPNKGVQQCPDQERVTQSEIRRNHNDRDVDVSLWEIVQSPNVDPGTRECEDKSGEN